MIYSCYFRSLLKHWNYLWGDIFSRYFARSPCHEFIISQIRLTGNFLVCFFNAFAGSQLLPCKFILCLWIVIWSAKRENSCSRIQRRLQYVKKMLTNQTTFFGVTFIHKTMCPFKGGLRYYYLLIVIYLQKYIFNWFIYLF